MYPNYSLPLKFSTTADRLREKPKCPYIEHIKAYLLDSNGNSPKVDLNGYIRVETVRGLLNCILDRVGYGYNAPTSIRMAVNTFNLPFEYKNEYENGIFVEKP